MDCKEPPQPCSLLVCGAPPDYPTQHLTDTQLFPTVPSVHLDNSEQALSTKLQDFCLEHPITVIRGIAAVLNLSNISYINFNYRLI